MALGQRIAKSDGCPSAKMVKTRKENHKRVLSRFASRRPQTPAEASLEASLKIQRLQSAGRPCYEAETTPLAVENGVGKLAAKLAPNVSPGKRAWRTPKPTFVPV